MRFSQALLMKYSQEDIYGSLVTLHELWYKINGLETKYSDIAARYKEEYKADFYTLAPQVIDSIVNEYNQWLYDHTKEGRVEILLEWGLRDNGYVDNNNWIIDIRDFVGNILEEKISSEMDWIQEFQDIEFDSHANVFLSEYLKQPQIENDDAYEYIKDNNLIDKYYEWSVSKGNYENKFILEDNYGNDWWVNFKEQIGDILIQYEEEIKDEVWNQWLEQWPGYNEVFAGVEEATRNLESAKGSQDINQTMSIISLALNTVHNSGVMMDHFLTKEQMSSLSNLDTTDWDRQLAAFARKVKCQKTFLKTIHYKEI